MTVEFDRQILVQKADTLYADLAANYPVRVCRVFDELRQVYFKYYGEIFLQNANQAVSFIDWVARMMVGSDLAALRGMSILDIACGCDTGAGDGFLPITPIFCGAMGMQVVGIDQHRFTGSGANYYTHVVCDLTASSLDFAALTGRRQFDVVQCSLFLDTGIDSSSPSLLEQIDGNHAQALEILGRVQQAAWNVVAPGGYLLWSAEPRHKPTE